MGGTHTVVVGDRGRVVLPAELRERLQLEVGTPLLVIETSEGLVLMTRAQARGLLREQLAGTDLVAELLSERRAAAADDA